LTGKSEVTDLFQLKAIGKLEIWIETRFYPPSPGLF